jgi:hypothetical protein
LPIKLGLLGCGLDWELGVLVLTLDPVLGEKLGALPTLDRELSREMVVPLTFACELLDPALDNKLGALLILGPALR